MLYENYYEVMASSGTKYCLSMKNSGTYTLILFTILAIGGKITFLKAKAKAKKKDQCSINNFEWYVHETVQSMKMTKDKITI